MHDYVENMVRLRSIMFELRVTTPFGEDYGFICTCITGSTKSPKSNPLWILLGDGTTPDPTMFVGKSRLSVASHVDYFQDNTWLATALRPKKAKMG